MSGPQIQPNLPPHIPPPAPPQNYLFQTLPVPVVGNVGDTVSLSTILTTEFGKNLDGYKDFYIGYFGSDALHYANGSLSFWNASPTAYANWDNGGSPPGTMTRWAFANSNATLYAANFDQLPAPDY